MPQTRARDVPWTTRSVPIGDLEIVAKLFEHRSAEAVSGPTYVLVHGIGVSSRYFQPLAEELARTGTVWTVDLPGYGAARKPRRVLSIEELAEVVVRFTTQLGLDNPVLVGHSMGCQVVAALAEAHPGLSDRIVLLAPTINPAERSLVKQALRLVLDGAFEHPRANWRVSTDYLLRCGPRYYLQQAPSMLGDTIEARLPFITVPTLVVAGDRDFIVPVDWAREMVRLLPHGTLEVVRAPHVMMFAQPVAIAERIAEHCRR